MRPVWSVSSSAARSSSQASPRLLAQDFVLRVLQLQAVRRHLELAEQDDALVRVEDVGEKRLVEPDRAQRAGRVARRALEDPEARPARRPDAAADDLADDRRRCAGLQRGNRLEAAAVFVADRESGRADLRWCAGRRAAGRRRGAGRRLSGTEGGGEIVHASAQHAADLTARYGLSPFDLDLADVRRQLERIVQADAAGFSGVRE